ncbi:MAG TPA: hemerythrin domain-containing protein [Bdellovibrio sp.]|uniref:hemerythrin domain-containing protein n=1 Tax=Bdellovibrio sp. TaxID=28201 RepID=UPI002EE4BFAA
MEIYESILRDHSTIKSWVKHLMDIPAQDSLTRDIFLEQLQSLLLVHFKVEELTFYVPLKAANNITDVTSSSHSDHHRITKSLLALHGVSEASRLHEQLEEFKTLVESHLTQEEAFMFLVGKAHLSAQEAAQLSAAYELMKESIRKEGIEKQMLYRVINLLPSHFSQDFKNVFQV